MLLKIQLFALSLKKYSRNNKSLYFADWCRHIDDQEISFTKLNATLNKLHLFSIKTSKFFLGLGCSYFLALLAPNCSYPVFTFSPNYGYFRVFLVLCPNFMNWALILLKPSTYRLRIVLRLFLFFGVFEPHCSYKIVLIKEKECIRLFL